jgi:hypothetical protein
LLAILSARPASLALTISMTIFFYHALLIDPTWVSWWLGGGKQVFQLFNDFFSAARRICCSPDTLVSSGVFVEPFLQGDADHDSAPVGSDYCIKHKETSWTKGNSPSRTTWFAKERYRATVPNDGQRLVRFYFLHISCKQQRC